MILSFALALAALQAADQVPDCANAMAQMEMTECANRAFERADAELNRLWRDIVAGAQDADREHAYDSGPTYEATIRAAQRAWIAFRDQQCTYEGFAERGGSMEPMVAAECRTRLTRERIAQLSPQPTPDQSNDR